MKDSNRNDRLVPWVLFIITAAALLIRVLYFNTNPPALNQDEAMNGYNAFSLSRNLRDSWGFFLPSLMHGFGNVDYRSPLYAYMSAPFVGLMGLSDTSTRMAALVFNTALVPLTYIFTRRLFSDKILALASAALLALCPWSIHYSRIGHEAVLSPFFYLLLAILLLKAINDKNSSWGVFIAVGVVSGLSVYTYQIARMLSPMIVAFICSVYFKNAISKILKLIVSGLIGLIIIFPMIYSSIINPGNLESRFEQVSIFSSPGAIWSFITNYFSHFSPDFLFLSGDYGNLPATSGRYGMLGIYMAPLLIMGVIFLIYMVVKRKEIRKESILTIGFLLLYPLPASLTVPSPHALRAYTLLPVLCVISALGLKLLYHLLYRPGTKRWLIPAVYSSISVIILIVSVSFLIRYYRYYPAEIEEYYQYGTKQAMQYLDKVQDNYEHIYITDNINQPFVYVLFYTSYDPVKYQQIDKTADLNSFGFVNSFDKYTFLSDSSMPLNMKNSLYITGGKTQLKGRNLLETVNDSSGYSVLKIWN